jgi:hypothetical protein
MPIRVNIHLNVNIYTHAFDRDIVKDKKLQPAVVVTQNDDPSPPVVHKRDYPYALRAQLSRLHCTIAGAHRCTRQTINLTSSPLRCRLTSLSFTFRPLGVQRARRQHAALSKFLPSEPAAA